MKTTFITAIAALASSVIAAPTPSLPGLDSVTNGLPLDSVSVPSGVPTALPSAGAGGHIVQDLAPEVRDILEVTGPNAKRLLIQLSPEVAALLSGLGLPGVGVAVGSIVASASSVGDLVYDLGAPVEELLTVVGQDGGALLIQLSPSVAGLVSGLGLPSVGIPVGTVVATLGSNLKRSTGKIVQDLAPEVRNILEITGPNAKRLLLQLSPEVAALLAGLGLPGVGASVGSIIASASSVGDLVKDLGAPVEGLLTVVGQDGGALLIQLSPSVAALVSGLGLPSVGVPVGTIVGTVGDNL